MRKSLYGKAIRKNFNRPVYKEPRSKLRFGDVLVVHALSRFSQNKEEIRDEWRALIQEEVDLVVLNMSILDTRKYKEREGIEIAKAKGKDKGGKKRYHARGDGEG